MYKHFYLSGLVLSSLSGMALSNTSKKEPIFCVEKSSQLERCIYEKLDFVIPKGFKMNSFPVSLQVKGELESSSDRLGVILKAQVNGQKFSDLAYFPGYTADEIEKLPNWKTPIELNVEILFPEIEACAEDTQVNLRVSGYKARNHDATQKKPEFIEETYNKFEFNISKIECNHKEDIP